MNTTIDRLGKSRESVQVNRGKKKHPSGPRLWLWMIGISALALALVFPLRMAFAVHDDGLFELGNGLDGDAAVGSADIIGDLIQGGPDWDDLFDASGNLKSGALDTYGGLAAVFIMDERASKGAKDNTTFTGSKNNDPHSAWQWVTGNVPAKDDLSNVYLYAATKANPDPQKVDDLILYAGLERLDPGGDSHIDIEINQIPIGLDENGGFTGEKSVNDILLVMDFKNGGDLGFVEIHSWDGTEWILTDKINNGSGEGCDADDNACAFNNNAGIFSGPWPSYNRQDKVIQDLPRNAFTEMGVNVTQLLDGQTPCFTSVIVKTRSSASLTSDLKDFVIGKFGLCDAQISIDDGGLNPVGVGEELTVTVKKKDGETGFEFLPTEGITVTGSFDNDPGSGFAPYFEGGSTCQTFSDGTCTLTVNSNSPSEAIVSASAANIFPDIPEFSITTDGEDGSSPPATVNWVDVRVLLSLTGGGTFEVGKETTYDATVQTYM